jgi:hypothetical protein
VGMDSTENFYRGSYLANSMGRVLVSKTSGSRFKSWAGCVRSFLENCIELISRGVAGLGPSLHMVVVHHRRPKVNGPSHCLIAQMAEHPSHKGKIDGSSPSQATHFMLH